MREAGTLHTWRDTTCRCTWDCALRRFPHLNNAFSTQFENHVCILILNFVRIKTRQKMMSAVAAHFMIPASSWI